MKRKRLAKRAVAGLLLAALLTVQTAAGTLAFAEGTEDAKDEQGNAQEGDASENTTAHYYGEQILELTDLSQSEREDAKAIYDALSSSLTPDNLTIKVKLPNGFSLDANASELTPEQKAQIEAYVKRIGQTALDAYEYDNPETFWIDLGTTKFRYGYLPVPINGVYSVNVTSVTAAVGVLNAHQISLLGDVEKFEQAVDEVSVDETSRYTIVKSIHDMLIEKNVYDRDGTYAYEAYGALVDGHSVCEAYAEAFKVMCDQYYVPCVLVSGSSINASGEPEAHMWNYVQMEDGKWYGVDITWDDQGTDGTFYDFFLAGANTVAAHFSGGSETFAKMHTPDGDFDNRGYVSFTYPTLTDEKYANGIEDEPDTPDDPADDITYGDANNDGDVGASDALTILKHVVSLEPLTGKQLKAADVDNSGNVDATDALYVLKYVVNLISSFPAEQG